MWNAVADDCDCVAMQGGLEGVTHEALHMTRRRWVDPMHTRTAICADFCKACLLIRSTLVGTCPTRTWDSAPWTKSW